MPLTGPVRCDDGAAPALHEALHLLFLRFPPLHKASNRLPSPRAPLPHRWVAECAPRTALSRPHALSVHSVYIDRLQAATARCALAEGGPAGPAAGGAAVPASSRMLHPQLPAPANFFLSPSARRRTRLCTRLQPHPASRTSLGKQGAAAQHGGRRCCAGARLGAECGAGPLLASADCWDCWTL